ncbi:hypothetical protein B0H14DRAFT_2610579 [Mycena olivaceomarginata]|nr:hypothetical protein B0H14DRAFT_2610579 [Mycena olivaceomarginata]
MSDLMPTQPTGDIARPDTTASPLGEQPRSPGVLEADSPHTPPRPEWPGAESPRPDGPPAAPAVITVVKKKIGRHRKGEPKARPGKLSWIHGTKKVFFGRRKEEWLRESEAKRAGPFYTRMAKLYLKKYGYHLADDEDFAEDIEDPPDSAADEVVHEVMTEEEQAFRAKYLTKLRGRIGQWYREEYGGLLKTDQAAFKDLFTGILDGAPPKPQRSRVGHFYSRKYYESRVKPHVEARLAALKRRSEAAGEPMPEYIDVIAKVTAEVWGEETPAFQHECQLAMEREHQEDLRGWEASLADSPTKTPEEIAANLENAAYYLQPFVDAIQQRFGMCASVLLAGPIGIREGKSECEGKTKGLAPVNWPKHDWQGFEQVEKSMISFARECFSETECNARAVSRAEESESGSGRALSEGATPPCATTVPTATTPSTAPTVMMTPPVTMPSTVTTTPPATTPPTTAMPPTATTPPIMTTMPPAGTTTYPTTRTDKDGEVERQAEYDEYWHRDDRAEWTDELGRAHATFERRRGWGLQWALCVQKFLEFEAAWGFTECTYQMAKKNRPGQIGGWLSRGRKWTLPPTLGETLGTRKNEELWPNERVTLENGELSRPEEADWSAMAAMHGKNGILQVMATLGWWGEVAQKRSAEEKDDWLAAVGDVTWVLGQILESGEIVREDDDVNDGEEHRDGEAKRKRTGGGHAEEG